MQQDKAKKYIVLFNTVTVQVGYDNYYMIKS